MSKSLKRVRAALEAAGIKAEMMEMPSETRTAQQAADAAGCALDQIAKSIIFQGQASGAIFLFITAGGNRVAPDKASALAGEALTRADANAVRNVTGFAIGGVAPLGHLNPIPTFFDRRLTEFDEIWGAGGTPRHIFRCKSAELIDFLALQPTDFTD